MLYRSFLAGIVIFWAVMTFLLIRSEFDPEKSGLLNVPLAHVVKMLFIGGQVSELAVTTNHQQVGNLLLRPKATSTPGAHSLQFSGNAALTLPFLPRQRVAWEGSLDTDPAFHLTRVKGIISFRESANRLFLDIFPQKQIVQYKIKQGDRWLSDSSFAMNRSGVSALLKSLDLDERSFTGVSGGAHPPEVTASRGTVRVRDERIESYVVSFRQGDLSIADIYVSQLGQVLFVRTTFGCTMAGEDISP